MVWIRYGKIRAIWKCTTARGYDTKYHAIGVSIKDEYENKPEEDIENWVNRLGDFVARMMCRNACGSLSTSVYCDEGSAQSETVYTSEMLVARPSVKEEKQVEEEKVEEEKKLEKIKAKIGKTKVEEIMTKVPAYILGQIEILETRYNEAESTDEKMAIREEIDDLKRRYGVE
jgi:hypothetical protein